MENYKMHIYETTGPRKGDRKEIRFYNDLESMVKDYNKLFKRDLCGLNPLCYKLDTDNNYKRICFNANFTINYLW